MTRAKRPATSRLAALTASAAIHAAILAALAGIRIHAATVGEEEVVASRIDATITLRPEPADGVVVERPVAAAPRPPEPRPESPALPDSLRDLPDASTPGVPTALETNPSAPFRRATRIDLSRRFRIPGGGRRGAVAATGAGAGGPIGLAAVGIAAVGGDGSGSRRGAGGGSGRDGAGLGGDAAPARGGATRAPAVAGRLAPPAYPDRARARGWEGRVVLLLSVDERGRVLSADVAESSGRSALDDAAREAALDWTLAPALRDGEPVAGTLRVPVRFELTD